jgi:anti-sigma-K factor RskA
LNIQEYIESGIIECYVLGAVSEAEKAEVEQLAAKYPEVKAEIEANKFALAEYILQFQCQPPQELKGKVIEKLQNLAENDEDELKQIKFIAENKPIPLKNRSFNWYPYLTAAAFALLMISVSLDYFFYIDWQQAEKRLSNLSLENEKLNKKLFELQAQNQTLAQEVRIISNKSNQTVELKGLPEYPNAWVTVYWNTQSKEVFLHVHNLPPPPKGKQYQLWSIIDNKPQDAGMVQVNHFQDNLLKMKRVQKAIVFAITLEKEGGVPIPEGQMYVKGEVSI